MDHMKLVLHSILYLLSNDSDVDGFSIITEGLNFKSGYIYIGKNFDARKLTGKVPLFFFLFFPITHRDLY
jgi:hypothetical protein